MNLKLYVPKIIPYLTLWLLCEDCYLVKLTEDSIPFPVQGHKSSQTSNE
jgi:hypothetical protein